MLNPNQQTLWQQLESTLNREQLIWLSGYAAGKAGVDGASNAVPEGTQRKLSIFFATETGNSKTVANQLLKAAKGAGIKVSSKPVTRLKVEDLAKLDHPTIFVASTHGEGDPPETSVKFFDALKAGADGALASVEFATLGLGDSSYAEFCGFARKVDAELERMGAKPFHPRKELDVDFADHTSAWVKEIVAALPDAENAAPTPAAFAMPDDEPIIHTGRGYSRLQPVTGTVKDIINLNDIGSNKETYHIEIAYDEHLHYAPGDAAGIIFPHAEGEEPITPRLYSIASSPLAHEHEVHLTVAHAWHTNEDGSKGYGVCSHYLADLKEGDEVEFYIHQNQLFKLPADDRDIIMIGPGTGIAPFRSFVWERNERDAQGRNWLFFGDQHAHCDFLYQQEWIDFVDSEALHKIDLAFSRDQADKVYVQHKLQQKADELVEWLDAGASLYVCGAKDPMSKDVDAMLRSILAQKKGGDDAADDYLAELEETERYVKDVY